MGITNYKLPFCLFFPGADITPFSGNGSAFQAGGYSGGIIVRRSATYGYESYCLSGKGEAVNGRPRLRWVFVFEDVFWLGKPNFHNRRIHSAVRTNIRNLPGRQNIRYSYVTLTNNSREYHNPLLPGGQLIIDNG